MSKPAKRRSSAKSLLLGGVGGVFLGIFLSKVAPRFQGNLLLLWIPITYAVVFFHELGHACAATLAGMRVVRFKVGPVVVRHEPRGWRVRLVRVQVFGGLTAALPQTSDSLKKRMLIFIAGGPLGSLLSGTLALIVARLAPGISGSWISLLWFFGGISMLTGVLNCWPMKAAGFLSDGARIRMLYGDAARTDRWLACTLLSAAGAAGIRPREWDSDLLQRALALHDGEPDEAGAHHLAYARDLDCGDVTAAASHLERMQELAPSLSRIAEAIVAWEGVYFEAAFRRDAVAARSRLKATKKGMGVERTSILRAEAALAWSEDRTAEADAIIKRARAALNQCSNLGFAAAMIECLERAMSGAAASVSA